jgi:dTDP-4-dehydrorhamnose reductase
MRAAVIGRSGQLARCLLESVPEGVELAFFGRQELDIASDSHDLTPLEAFEPDIAINAAAYTAVDKAESDRDAAFALNALGPSRLAGFSAARRIPLIHISTDYVFDGSSRRPYVEDDAVAPLNVYGKSKLMGEQAVIERQPKHVILRTSWLFSAYGHNFVKTMLALGKERPRLRIVADQFGCPTSAHDLARTIWTIAASAQTTKERAFWGTYHYAGRGVASWADFAKHIFMSPQARLVGTPQVEGITTAEYPTPAARPQYSALDCARIEQRLGIQPLDWEASVSNVLARLERGIPA